MNNDIPESFPVKKIVQESETVKTFYLDKEFEAKPGQFVMIWLPSIDEKPFTVSAQGESLGITVEKKGRFTEKLFNLKEGEFLGVRGPYGNGFELKEKACVVGGGLGVAAIVCLVEELKAQGKEVDTIIGAREKGLLLFQNRLEKASDNLYIITDDGSSGRKGFTTQVLLEQLEKERYDAVYTCGPEIMIVKVLEVCDQKGVDCFASLERYMKCGGLGLCGQCSMGELRVCIDGPIFSSKQLLESKEFGKEARLKTGKKVGLKEYVAWRGK